MARKFIFNDNEIINLDDMTLKLIGKEVNHIHVNRYNIDDDIVINDMKCVINKINKDSVIVTIKEKLKIVSKNYNLSVFQAYLKSNKMELVIQKLTEIGANNIVPFLSTNTVVKLDDKSKLKKKEKLDNVCKEAIKQSGRDNNIKINEIITFKGILSKLTEYDIVLFAYENDDTSLKETLKSIQDKESKKIAIVIGPEGGFSLEEVNKLKDLDNLYSISLGNNILRAETASIYLTSIVKYEFEKE